MRPAVWPGLLLLTAAEVLGQTGEVRFPFGLAAAGAGVPARGGQAGSAADVQSTFPPPDTPPVATVYPRRFIPAAGELVLLEVLPWAFNRYVTKEDFARISFVTIKKNFQTGFKYDSDDFKINQSSHPYHGSLFFNGARSNGYGYWESAAFTLAGSLMWECCMENTAPSVNDLVNTTLGGMTRGEIAHRLATVVRADRIVFLESGRVVETGTHVELMGRAGAYGRMLSAYVEGR
jgi:hypothetical protein